MISNNIVVFSYSVLAEELIQTPEASPELTKRSWFGSLMSTDRDETYTIIVKEKPLASIKADLVQAFLSVSLPYTSTQKGFRSKSSYCATVVATLLSCFSKVSIIRHGRSTVLEFEMKYSTGGLIETFSKYPDQVI